MTAPKIYSPEYYQLLYEIEDRHWWNKGMKKIAAVLLDSQLQSSTALRILDAGCGTGNFLNWLTRYPAAMRVGIDISSHALRFCSARNCNNVAKASVTDLPFQNASFDLITCNDVLQHVASKDEHILQEFFRVLSNEGFVYLRTNAVQRFDAIDDSAEDYHRYTKEEVEQKASAAGFRILRTTFANSFPSLAADFRNLLASRKKRRHHHQNDEHAYAGLIMKIPATPINAVLSWFMNAEARYLSSATATLRFGHSLVFVLQKTVVQ